MSRRLHGAIPQSAGVVSQTWPWREPTAATPSCSINSAAWMLLIVDDWAMAPLTEGERRDFLEICDARYQTRSTLLTSQLPVASWHAQIGDPTIADSHPRPPGAQRTPHRTQGRVDAPQANFERWEGCMRPAAGLSVLMWGEGLNRRPSPHTPLPAQNAKRLTDADHFRIMKQASVASLR